MSASLAAAAVADNPSSPPPPPEASAVSLLLDYRADDPDALEYRDVALADVDGVAGMEIVRVGLNGSTFKANVSVSRFTLPGGFVNLSGNETDIALNAYFTRVATGQLDPDPVPEIVISGRAFNQTQGEDEPAVFVYKVASPPTLVAMRTMDLSSFTEFPEFYGVATGDLDGDSTVEYIGVGGPEFPPSGAYNRTGTVDIGHLAGNALVPEYTAELRGSWVTYRAVAVADLDGLGLPEVVLAGQRDNLSYLGVARMEAGALSFKANVSFGALFSQVEAVAAGEAGTFPGLEILTCGHQPQATATEALVTKWGWDGGASLILLESRNWTGRHRDAACFDVELVNSTGGPEPEYVASVGYNRNDTSTTVMMGELILMDFTLREVEKLQWKGSDIDHWGAASGDVDGDGKTEIVSVGMKWTGVTYVGETQVVEVPGAGWIAAPATVLALTGYAAGWVRLRRRLALRAARAPPAP